MDIVGIASATNTYDLKCTLLDIKPPIWRRLRVPGDLTLGDIHTALQTAFAWDDRHLHSFNVDGTEFSQLDEEDDDADFEDEDDVTLDELGLTKKSRIFYTYDFGDDWEVRVKVEKIEDRGGGLSHPICLDGARAAPPDDCGGIPGYYHLAEVMSAPKHPEREDLIEWLGYEFDPEEFDIDDVNEELEEMAEGAPSIRLPLPWIDRAAERMAKGAADAAAPAPTDAEQKALYEAVIRYRDAAPWRAMPDDLNEAIQNPETGERGVFAVLGNAGELMGLALYRGDRGYDSLWRVKNVGLVDETDLFATQDCLSVTFGSKEELEDDEVALLKSLKLKFRGKAGWPVARAFDPGYAPRPLNGAEARYMTLALDRVIEVAAEYRQRAREIVPHEPEASMALHILSDGKWRIEPYEPHFAEIVIPRLLPDERVIKDLLKLPSTDGCLEIDFFSIPIQMEDPAGRLVMPFAVLGADAKSLTPLAMETAPFDEVMSVTLQAVVSIIKTVEMRPEAIAVRRPELADLLAPLADRIQVRVDLEDDLISTEAIRLRMLAEMAGMDLNDLVAELH